MVLGLMMIAGITPFRFGFFDLEDRGGSSFAFALASVPVAWFVAYDIFRLLPREALPFLRGVLFFGFAVGALASLRAQRGRYLVVLRSALLPWALMILTVAPTSSYDMFLSLVAYMTVTLGLETSYRLLEGRVGSKLMGIPSVGRSIDGLGGFWLVFTLALSGMPLSANFNAIKVSGQAAVDWGVGFVVAEYLLLAVLGYSAYRLYTQTFGGPSQPLPPGLGLSRRERVGLVAIVAISVGSALSGITYSRKDADAHHKSPPTNAAAGMVKTHAQTMRSATPQRTDENLFTEPTPMMEPAIVWVDETGRP
ncbi:hypothetical protein E3A20_26060 [Planctomyces bekefii]|uniref:Uncharacterized protein n=1 Tax=Planctomyces bekefii TaxID=1653850 RepID=A0A5C6M2E3_9PLAN|nr:hypothetical protein E3A20_26060 [Planctomyces bekefii]